MVESLAVSIFLILAPIMQRSFCLCLYNENDFTEMEFIMQYAMKECVFLKRLPYFPPLFFIPPSSC